MFSGSRVQKSRITSPSAYSIAPPSFSAKFGGMNYRHLQFALHTLVRDLEAGSIEICRRHLNGDASGAQEETLMRCICALPDRTFRTLNPAEIAELRAHVSISLTTLEMFRGRPRPLSKIRCNRSRLRFDRGLLCQRLLEASAAKTGGKP